MSRDAPVVPDTILDIYTHFLPQSFLAEIDRLDTRFGLVNRLKSVAELYDLEARFKAMDAMGPGYRQVISLPNPPIEAFASGADGRRIAAAANDGLAALVDAHGDRFAGFAAALPMDDPDAALAEARRAINQLGARGIQIFTNVNGKPLDLAEYEPVFAEMAAQDLPVWLHPARTAEFSDYAGEARSRYEMWWCFGWPYETSVAVSRLVLTGLFDRYPQLKLITHHMGGMIPFFDERISKGMAVLGKRTNDEDYSGIIPGLQKPLIDYYRGIYGDTALFGGELGLKCGFEFFGPAHVLFASDTPFSQPGPVLESLAALGAGAEALRQIKVGNARRLLRLDTPA